VERSSAKPLLFLRQLPWWLPLILVLGLMITGFVVPGWIGAVALVLVAAFLAWLAYISWPRVKIAGRVLRITAVACMLGAAVLQARR
jgi:membrane-bound ClpP family serine protease